MLRRVVPTNTVHIVQKRLATVSYGAGMTAGNAYWKWPTFIPVIGNSVTELPLSVFQETLDEYPGYDKGRVPFLVDIIAFFRIENPNIAAARVPDFQALRQQLQGILMGALRSILAQSDIEEILEARAKFGEMFTQEVNVQLKEWGVCNVKCIELMDIRDQQGSKVIENIMAKKKSLIEMESRTAVAKNTQLAQTAEVEAAREVALRKQEAEQTVGIRTAETQQQVKIRQQQAEQAVQDAAAETARKTQEVNRVNMVRTAEINREAQVIDADRVKQVTVTKANGDQQAMIVAAEGNRQKEVLEATGKSDAQKKLAEAIEATGAANGAAATAMQMAPVTAQLKLAAEIGANEPYQAYLIEIRKIEANEKIGVEQAGALKAAQVKVIANAGNAGAGLDSVRDLFSAKGGLALGSAVEAFANTDTGAKVLGALGVKPNGSTPAAH